MSSFEMATTTDNTLSPLRARAPLTPSRVMDVAVSLAALLFISPLLLTIAILIRIQDGGPALFGQSRIGLNGKMFTCFKLRSMVLDSDARLEALLSSDPVARLEWDRDHKLREDPRITRLGGFLRRSSLDELPQLFNVLRGEMSLVGPRPIVPKERVKYGSKFAAYCSVTPGITGLWQVSGRNNVSYRRRVAMDVVYSRSKSLSYDLAIIFKTVPAVLTRRGSY